MYDFMYVRRLPPRELFNALHREHLPQVLKAAYCRVCGRQTACVTQLVLERVRDQPIDLYAYRGELYHAFDNMA